MEQLECYLKLADAVVITNSQHQIVLVNEEFSELVW